MFDVAPTELIVLGTVALLVIPPKDLPRAMRTAGYWVGRARGVARQFRSGFDNMVREAELEEMERRWREENERIMREHPPTRPVDADPAMTRAEAPSDHGAGEPHLAPQPALVTAGTAGASTETVSVEHPVVIAPEAAGTAHSPADTDGKAMS